MDISEKRLPQDGRFSVMTSEGSRDYRVATVPMLEGEKAVVRVLMQNLSKLDFKKVGYTERNIRIYEELLSKPHGLLLHFPNRPEVAVDLRRFAVDEKRCCQFWGFAVVATADSLTLRWDGPHAADDLLERLRAYFKGDEPLTSISGLL